MKKRITIELKADRLVFDVMEETYLKGRTVGLGGNHREAANVYATMDPDEKAKISRSIKTAYGELKTELAEYINTEDKEADNDAYDAETDLTLALDMPANFNEAATEGLAASCHRFIVNKTVAEWYAIVNPGEMKTYYQLAAESMMAVRDAACRRERPGR